MPTGFGVRIKDRADYWLSRQCRETKTNGGGCVDEIHELYGDKTLEAWCAKFAYVVVDEAAAAYSIRNTLPHEKGAARMRDQAIKQKIHRVDRVPAVGAVFYRRSLAKGASGHIGIVVELHTDQIITIEGNAGDMIAVGHYSMGQVNDPYWKFSFIHTELMAGESEGGSLLTPVLITTSVALSTYLIARSIT